MVNLILISMTLGRNWKIFFLIFSRFCSFSLSQYPFHPSVSLLAEDRAPCLHAVGLLGHVGTSLTCSLPPTENMRFVPAVAVGTVSPVPPGQSPHSPPPPPGAAAWLMWMHILEKAEGKGGKKNHSPLNSQVRNLLLGRWYSHNSEFHIQLIYFYYCGCIECGICLRPLLAQWREVSAMNKHIKEWLKEQRVFRGWPWGSSRMDWGWNCGSVLMFLFCWFHFFHFFQVERWKRECCSPGGRLMGGEDSSGPLREY